MALPSPTKIAAIVLIAVAIAVPLALQWGFKKYEKEEVGGNVVAIVKDTTARCRDALSAEPTKAPKAGEIEARLRDHVATIDRYAVEIRNVPQTAGRSALVQAATDYVLTCREILLRQTASYVAFGPLSDSMQALRDHMRGNSRASGWPEGAVRTKARLDEAYREYRTATDAYVSLLDSFLASHPKIAAQIDRANLIDEAFLKEASARATQISTQAASEMKKLTRLESYR